MATKKGSDWAKKAIGKPETAPTIAHEGNTTVTATGLVRPVRKPSTYRLPQDALDIIAQAVADEAALGNRLTKDAAVTEAVREWGKLRARRRG